MKAISNTYESSYIWAKHIKYGELHGRPTEKILAKFPMENRIVTVSGKTYNYYFVDNKILWVYTGQASFID